MNYMASMIPIIFPRFYIHSFENSFDSNNSFEATSTRDHHLLFLQSRSNKTTGEGNRK